MTVPTLQFLPADGSGARPAPQSVAELSPAAAALARLLPSVYLARNEAIPGRPLLTLLEVVAAQLEALERAATQLLDDRFVERASGPALRLLAELVGAQLTGEDPRTHRAVVARTLHWRRRKGTLATLEDVLRATSGWPAEVDEAYRSLLIDQDLAAPQPWRGRSAVLWDPVSLADPLSRRARGNRSARDPEPGLLLARRPQEDVEQTLRRVGAVDAGRYAASPRTVDLLGWARPDRAVIRTDRLTTAELDGLDLGPGRPVTHRSDPTVAFRGFTIDPRGRELPLAGRFPVAAPDQLAALTALHEPAPAAQSTGHRDGILTPTGLAHDPEGLASADTLSVFVDGIRLVGPPDPLAPGAALASGLPQTVAAAGPRPVLRLADASRPQPGQEWDLRAYALRDPSDVPAELLPDVPAGAPDSPLLLSTRVRHRGQDDVVAAPAAQQAQAGATVALRLVRVAGDETAHLRAADGTWSTLTAGPRGGPVLSGAVLVALPGGDTAVRLERTVDGAAVATWRPDDPTSRWDSQAVDLTALADADLPDLDPPARGPALALVAAGDAVLLVAPVRSDVGATPGLGLWRITAEGSIARLDGAALRRPSDRVAPSAVLVADLLVLHGGMAEGQVLDDTWSVPVTGPSTGLWRARSVRHRVARVGGCLVPTPAGVVLVGGASSPGALEVTVHRVDLDRARPAWQRLPDLPVAPDAPGVLVARAEPAASGAGVEVLAWLDAVRPVRLRSDAARGWRADPPEQTAPNPPADGEALFRGADLLVVGPPPLPPCEVVVGLGGVGRLAFLPAVDPAPGEALVLTVADDGSTRRWLAAGEPTVDDLRLGAGRAASPIERTSPASAVGAPGRLAWRAFQLRQVSLAPWEAPVALTLADAVGVDPRLGRILLREEIAGGAVTATVRIARSAAIGAGFAPADAAVPRAWDGPDLDLGLDDVPIQAWVSPARAGLDGPAGRTLHARIAEAIDALAPPAPGPVDGPVPRTTLGIAVLGSPVLAPEMLVAGQRWTVRIAAADEGTRPYLEADDGVSLALHERLAPLGGEDPDVGPTWQLHGLMLAGGVDLAASAGRLDLRWCTVAAPGEVAVRVAGAGHAADLVRHSLPRPRVAVRLVGCELGVLDVPPWVDVVAVGCTFDAGAPEAVAIAAAGAGVRLRHCTVHGRTVAGVLRASSSAFRGAVVTDRPDLGWLRYCVSPGQGRPPRAFRSVTASLSFRSQRATDPDHLRLDDNNGALLRAAEHGRTPGAHHDLADRLAELALRTDEFLPLALAPFHVDHALADLVRTRRLM